MPSNLLGITVAICTGALMLAMQSCAPTVTQPTIITPSPFVGTAQCTEKTIPPIITNIQPSQVPPGSETTVIGRGGYIQDSCGGFNESARTFKLYLDNESVGDLLCYVNHCEVKIDLASTIASGLHCLSTQKDICEFEFQVTPK
jgi:hypothetical protein